MKKKSFFDIPCRIVYSVNGERLTSDEIKQKYGDNATPLPCGGVAWKCKPYKS